MQLGPRPFPQGQVTLRGAEGPGVSGCFLRVTWNLPTWRTQRPKPTARTREGSPSASPLWASPVRGAAGPHHRARASPPLRHCTRRPQPGSHPRQRTARPRLTFRQVPEPETESDREQALSQRRDSRVPLHGSAPARTGPGTGDGSSHGLLPPGWGPVPRSCLLAWPSAGHRRRLGSRLASGSSSCLPLNKTTEREKKKKSRFVLTQTPRGGHRGAAGRAPRRPAPSSCGSSSTEAPASTGETQMALLGEPACGRPISLSPLSLSLWLSSKYGNKP